MENHNCCFVLQPRETDYVAGANSPIVFKAASNGDWTPYIEFFERQKFSWETDGCVLFAAQESFDAQMDNLIQSGHVPQSVIDQVTVMGFMDVSSLDGKPHFHSSPRFLHVLAATGQNGTPAAAPWDIMQKYGVLPWKDMPFDENMTQAEYFAAVSQANLDKAAHFLALIGGKNSIPYHWIVNGGGPGTQSVKMIAALPQAPLCIGTPVCEPWDQDQVPTCPIMTPAHSTMVFKMDSATHILDHYEPFEKTLQFSYNIPYCLQGILSPTFPAQPIQVPPLPANVAPTLQNVTILQQIVFLYQTILSLIKGRNLTSASNMDNQYPWWVSSTGQGIAQRIISLSALIIPVLSAFGINIAPGSVEIFVNGAFVVGFGIWQMYAWARADFNKMHGLGKYAPSSGAQKGTDF